MILAVVDWAQLGEVAWVSLAATLVIMLLFSVAVYGSSRVAEQRRAGASTAVFGTVATVCVLAFLGTVVLAIAVILDK